MPAADKIGRHLKAIDTFLDELVENEMILTMSKKIILNVTE